MNNKYELLTTVELDVVNLRLQGIMSSISDEVRAMNALIDRENANNPDEEKKKALADLVTLRDDFSKEFRKINKQYNSTTLELEKRFKKKGINLNYKNLDSLVQRRELLIRNS